VLLTQKSNLRIFFRTKKYWKSVEKRSDSVN